MLLLFVLRILSAKTFASTSITWGTVVGASPSLPTPIYTEVFCVKLFCRIADGLFNKDPLSHHKLGLIIIYLLNSVGFLIKISAANNPPNDSPIIVFELFVL